MPRLTHCCFLLLAVFFSTCPTIQQEATEPPVETPTADSPPSDPSAPKRQRLVRVATLHSSEANREFRRNVAILQNQRKHIIQRQTQWQKATDPEKKEALHQEIQAALKKLNSDNQQMQEHYRFSLNRNYVMIVEKSHIYIPAPQQQATGDSQE